MDKPKKGNTITVKINGNHKTFQEELQISEPGHDDPSDSNVIDINKQPPDPQYFSEAAASQESFDESFDWMIPESSDVTMEQFKPKGQSHSQKSGQRRIASFSKPSNKKNNPFSLGPVFFSALFAILIGTAIGFFMLKLVITDPGKKASTVNNQVEATAGTGKAPENAKTPSATVSIGQLTTYIVQGGIYSSQDGAKETAKQLSTKGIPAKIMALGGKTYIFLGVADSLETAKSLSSFYKQNGAEDTFAKQLLVDGKKLSGYTDPENSLIEAMPAVYKTLSNAASGAYVSNTISTDSKKALAAVEKHLTIKNIKNSKMKKLQGELLGASDKIKSFQKAKDTQSLNDAEQHLLNFLSLYNSL